ncbi:MAG TPA: hypothetical protein VMG09_10520 [Bacteroidota bacterium]|nr:hypothetical protein [Bacteroidota bacterium]
MRAILRTCAVLLTLVLIGCTESANAPDNVPPAPPSGLSTSAGDNFIELFWNKSQEHDVAGYNVFVSSSYDGRYDLIGSTRVPHFVDKGAVNGNVYYYAVTAYDEDGNESPLSKDMAYDIPRPEGYGVSLADVHQIPSASGYDFSRSAVVSYDDEYADMYFENYRDTSFMNVRTDTDIQDMGPTESVLQISGAPSAGWSPTHDVILQQGHTYVVWTWDDHYAKFRVSSLSPQKVVFDWVYQVRGSTPLLKHGAGERPPVVLKRPA